MRRPSRLVVVLKGWPRLSETFIAQELHALEQRGFNLVIVSLRHPTDPHRHPIHAAIKAPVNYLPEYLHDEPRRVLRALVRAVRRPGFAALLARWWRDLRRDPSRNRGRRLGQALVLAEEVLAPGDLVYAHFLHTPGSVARYAAGWCGLPLAFSAHAKDIWTIPEWEKREKLADARFAVTCTRVGAAHLNGLLPAPKVELVYHGLDLAALPAPPGRDPESQEPLELLCVARAVPKKGLELLLDALARVTKSHAWRLTHIGGGDTSALATQAAALGLADRVRFLGALPAPEVMAAYRTTDIFVLASRIAADGDRDGLPNVLMEALSQEVAVVATDTAAIPELIDDGVHGLLVPPDDAPALACALERLMAEPALRRRLAVAGRLRVVRDFSMDRGIDRLAELIGGAPVARAA